MIVTTTSNVEGHTICKYCGVVAGEVILSTDVFKDMFAGIRYLTGGRAGSNERELQKARDVALTELQTHATRLGANAVVGVTLAYEILGTAHSMLLVSASGTAVVLKG
ncbi:MAG: heavy metal-binding domain-containing protein [Comamonas sp.]